MHFLTGLAEVGQGAEMAYMWDKVVAGSYISYFVPHVGRCKYNAYRNALGELWQLKPWAGRIWGKLIGGGINRRKFRPSCQRRSLRTSRSAPGSPTGTA